MGCRVSAATYDRFFCFPKGIMTDLTADSGYIARLDSLTIEELRDEVIRYRAIANNRQRSLDSLKARDQRMWARWGELADKPISDPMLANEVDCIASELDHAFFILVDFAISKVR